VSNNPDQIRSFIAIELSGEAKEGLARLRRALENDEHRFVKWVDPGGIHLTLKFLGNIPSRRVSEITQAMEEAAQGISRFHLEISGLGVFPALSKFGSCGWVSVGMSRGYPCYSKTLIPCWPPWDFPERNARLCRI
jgi:RNA 2',3'-cyclic 3'-phosphodiesterase